MRLFILLMSTVLLSSSSCEEVTDSDTDLIKEEVTEHAGIAAIVTSEYAGEGCTFLLQIEEEREKVLLMPIELDEEFKKDSLKVLIKYHFSRIMQSECQKGRPIVIDSIKLVG